MPIEPLVLSKHVMVFSFGQRLDEMNSNITINMYIDMYDIFEIDQETLKK